MYLNSHTKDSTLTLAGLQQYRRTLGSGFTLSSAETYQLPEWTQVGFGSNFSDIRDNYDLFIERHIEALGLQLNPANLDFATLLVMGTIPGGLGSDQYFIPIMIFSSQGTALNVVDSTSPTVGTGITFSNVAMTSLTINWGAATDVITPQGSLEYLVVRAANTGLLNTVANAETNGTTILNYTANVTTANDSGLLANTSYAYAVIVRDSSGNKALYSAQSQSTLADSTAPTVGTGIQFSNTTDTSMDVSWGVATDDVTAQSNLEYKLVSSSTDNLTSVANAETNGSLWMDWTANTTQYPILGANPSTLYYFAVIVRDEAGNKALYTQQSNSTTAPSDTTAPSFSGSWSASPEFDRPNTRLLFTGPAATDNITPDENILYSFYRSTSNNISTVADAESNGFLADQTDGQTGTVESTFAGLSENTLYYLAVVCEDEAGNKAIATASASTELLVAPTVGTGIIAGEPTSSSVNLSWGGATGGNTGVMLYRVVYSTSNNIGTISDALANGTTFQIGGGDWNEVLSATVTGLSSSTTYYFAVIVSGSANLNSAGGGSSTYYSLYNTVSESTTS